MFLCKKRPECFICDLLQRYIHTSYCGYGIKTCIVKLFYNNILGKVKRITSIVIKVIYDDITVDDITVDSNSSKYLSHYEYFIRVKYINNNFIYIIKIEDSPIFYLEYDRVNGEYVGNKQANT